MKRHGFSFLEVLFLLAAVAILSAILLPVLQRARERDAEDDRKACQMNLKQIAISLLQYTQDYDELYPSVASRGKYYGWADALQPYVKSHRAFHCPTRDAIPATNPRANNYTDYWYNRRLSRVGLFYVKEPAITILMGDGNDGRDITNARYNKNALPPVWKTDRTKPSFRHSSGANYSFLDGHVKWVRPDKITTAKPDNAKGSYTFVVQ